MWDVLNISMDKYSDSDLDCRLCDVCVQYNFDVFAILMFLLPKKGYKNGVEMKLGR